MEVVVEDKQLSLAIGKKGQNVRLAAKLTGWRIDIKNEEEKRREVEAQFGALDLGEAETEAPAAEHGEVESAEETADVVFSAGPSRGKLRTRTCPPKLHARMNQREADGAGDRDVVKAEEQG